MLRRFFRLRRNAPANDAPRAPPNNEANGNNENNRAVNSSGGGNNDRYSPSTQERQGRRSRGAYRAGSRPASSSVPGALPPEIEPERASEPLIPEETTPALLSSSVEAPKSDSASPAPSVPVEGIEEECTCRICRCEGDDENPLFYPCKCTGSMRYVHEACLLDWIRTRAAASNGSSRAPQCDVCKATVTIAPVYDPAAPKTLPPWELLAIAVETWIKSIPTTMNYIFVCFAWGFVFPVTCAFMFHTAVNLALESDGQPPSATVNDLVERAPSHEYVSSESEQQEPQRLDALSYGYALSFFADTRPSSKFRSLASAFLTPYWIETGFWVISIGTFVFFFLLCTLDFVRSYEDGDYDEEIARRLTRRARAREAELEAERAFDEAERREREGLPVAEEEVSPAAAPAVAAAPAPAAHPAPDAPVAGPVADEDEDLYRDPGDDDQDELLRFQQNEERRQAALEARRDLGVEEWIGLRGNACEMFCNMFAVILILGGLMVCFYLLPNLCGKWVAKLAEARLKLPADADSYAPRLVFGLSMDHRLDAFRQCLVWYKDYDYDARAIRKTTSSLLKFIVGLACILLGEHALYRGLLLGTRLWRRVRQRAPHLQSRQWLTAPILRCMRRSARVQKVAFLILMIMVIVPFTLGVFMDKCLAPFMANDDATRERFVAKHYPLVLLTYWGTGVSNLLMVGVLGLVLRDSLHDQIAVTFFRAREPLGRDSLILPLLVESSWNHFKRTVVSTLVYIGFSYLVVWLPLHLISTVAGRKFLIPFSASIHHHRLEIPTYLLIFHSHSHHVLRWAKPGIVWAMTSFLRVSCSILGLEDHLLARPKDPAAYEAEQLRVLALHRGQAQHQQNEEGGGNGLHWLDPTPRAGPSYLQRRKRFRTLRDLAALLALLAASWVALVACIFGSVALLFELGVLCEMLANPSLTAASSDFRLFYLGSWALEWLVAGAGPARTWLRAATDARRRVDTGTVARLALLAFVGALLIFAPLTIGVAWSMLSTGWSGTELSPLDPNAALSSFPEYVAATTRSWRWHRAWGTGVAGMVFILKMTPRGQALVECCRDPAIGAVQLLRNLLEPVLALALDIIVVLVYTFWTFGSNALTSPSADGDEPSKPSAATGSGSGLTGLLSDPTIYVRFVASTHIIAFLCVATLVSHWSTMVAAVRQVHDSLRDNRYLVSRRLHNYVEPRAAAVVNE